MLMLLLLRCSVVGIAKHSTRHHECGSFSSLSKQKTSQLSSQTRNLPLFRQLIASSLVKSLLVALATATATAMVAAAVVVARSFKMRTHTDGRHRNFRAELHAVRVAFWLAACISLADDSKNARLDDSLLAYWLAGWQGVSQAGGPLACSVGSLELFCPNFAGSDPKMRRSVMTHTQNAQRPWRANPQRQRTARRSRCGYLTACQQISPLESNFRARCKASVCFCLFFVFCFFPCRNMIIITHCTSAASKVAVFKP